MPANSPAELDQLFQQHVRAGDLDALMALFEDGAAVLDVNGAVKTGVDAVRTDMAPLAAMKPDMTNTTNKVIVAGDVALIYTEWSMSRPGPMKGRGVSVARRQSDGTWKVLIDDPFTLDSNAHL